mgnify:CR=1 FL=1
MIPHEYIEELTRRTDIVELVGNYVPVSYTHLTLPTNSLV